MNKIWKKRCVCGGLPHKHKLSPANTLNEQQKLLIKKKKKKEAQMIWHPLCFHVSVEIRKKWKSKMVCGGNVASYTQSHTPQNGLTKSVKKIKNKNKKNEIKIREWLVCKSYCIRT